MGKNVFWVVLFSVIFVLMLGESTIVFAESEFQQEVSIAEKDKINFNSLTMNDGLSNNLITEIYQDSKGFIWIGTEDGLNQYDGSIVINYRYENNNTNSLSSNHITSIIEDSLGNIWVGTSGGLNIIEKDTYKIFRISDYSNLAISLSNYCITKLYRDRDDNIWVGTTNGLNKYDKEHEVFINYYAGDEEYSLTDNFITDIDEDESGFLLISTVKGITAMELKTNKTFNETNKYNNNRYVYKIDKDNSGNMWIVTKGGIIKKDYINDISLSYNMDIGEHMKNDINYVLCDNNDNIWFASSNGLIKHIPKENTTKLYKSESNVPNYLLSDSITCLYEDRNGVMWIGTDNGVSILNNRQQFSNRINNIFRQQGISGSSVTTFLEDSEHDLWIGTKQNGIIRFLEGTGEVLRYMYDEDNSNSLVSNTINDIIEGNGRNIIVATDKGIVTIDKGTNKVKVYSEEIERVTSFNQCVKMVNDGEDIWIATKDGLYRSNNTTYERENYKENFKASGINNYEIYDIFQDETDQDILWLASGTYGGLIKFHKQKGVIKNYLAGTSENSLSYDSINCITGDGNGNLWIGTGVGLNKFNIKDETFVRYYQEDGLISDYITSVVIDSNNDVWLGTSGGLSKFSIKENRFINFTESDGLYGSKFNKLSGLETSIGQLLFGTTKGVISLDPNSMQKTSTNENEVIIGGMWVNRERFILNGSDIEFKHNENNIIFKYFLPDYAHIGDIKYLYKLQGFDKNWSYINGMSFSSYTSLAPGNYTFRVKAIKSDGSVTDESNIEFKIKYPFWKTKEAYVVYLFCIMLVALYIWKQVKILRALVKKQTKEINHQMEENKALYERSIKNEKFKNDYFVNLSHELRTPINIILSVLQVINSLEKSNNLTKEKNTHYMDVIKKSSDNLLKIIGDIIDSSKIESGAYKINKQDNVDIVYLVEETALNMSEYIKENGIELIIDPEIEEKIICCDPKEIERCVINLIGNAVKFTEKGGEIKVLIIENENSVSISVEDNGLGISKDDQEFIFKRFEQGKNFNSTKVSSSGIGLTLVKYIVELHDGNVSLESEQNKGSKFTITLPGA